MYQIKGRINFIGRKITSFAMDVEKAVFDSGIEHVLPNGWVERIGNVDDGQLDWGCHFIEHV